jgi:hypothetical protein
MGFLLRQMGLFFGLRSSGEEGRGGEGRGGEGKLLFLLLLRRKSRAHQHEDQHFNSRDARRIRAF